jgi:putrescine aminotransferase
MSAASVADHIVDLIDRHSGDGPELYRRFINPGFAKLLELAGFGRRYVSAQGCELIDDHGRRYLDFVSGYGTINLGHNHPDLQQTLRQVLDRQIPSFSQVECSLLTGLAAQALSQRLGPELNRVFFCNSGSEAVDAAVKLARAATGKKRVVACTNGYHGNTLGVLGLTDNPQRRDAHRPLLPGITHVPFGDVEALREVLRWNDVAALVVEPVQGEGGVVVPPATYLSEAQEECHRANALLIVDEVQTGLGRTGALFAYAHGACEPDIVTTAKSLGGGLMPVAAMVAREPVFGKAYGSLRTCLDHRTTFGGGPLAMAAVLATMEIIDRENLVERARELGDYAKDRLRALAQRHDRIEEVRGLGLMLGLRVRPPSLPGLNQAAVLYAQYLAVRLIDDHAIVTQVAANDLTVLKIMPPLIAGRAEIDRLVAALDAVLADKGYAGALVDLARRTMAEKQARPGLTADEPL